MKTNKAHANWQGNLKKGIGTVKLNESGKEVAYNFSSRFEDGKGTNPEELIAAAHAGCFSMAFSGLLTEEGYEPKSIDTTAKVTIEKADGGFKISKSELTTEAVVPDIDKNIFKELAAKAKENCPVSQALSSLEITLEASLKE
ncbi:OsmC family peroxiredoxin [Maribellus comscasis]|uniref:OsmC family peroxiredoxin n=1 Tax=Maribellus comscasis TaxID=2681766 RepID=A0A6I6JP95_9BACT|nr:OsmC family protein [Maribellus comscasis]QGY42959.1 OsmC family peroxiredoxin [Maribellus comscasis]